MQNPNSLAYGNLGPADLVLDMKGDCSHRFVNHTITPPIHSLVIIQMSYLPKMSLVFAVLNYVLFYTFSAPENVLVIICNQRLEDFGIERRLLQCFCQSLVLFLQG